MTFGTVLVRWPGEELGRLGLKALKGWTLVMLFESWHSRERSGVLVFGGFRSVARTTKLGAAEQNGGSSTTAVPKPFGGSSRFFGPRKRSVNIE